MRQAIVTKYIGATNYRGSRVKATADAGSVTIPWDDALDAVENHRAACIALARKYGWSEHWIGGGRGVCVGERSHARVTPIARPRQDTPTTLAKPR